MGSIICHWSSQKFIKVARGSTLNFLSCDKQDHRIMIWVARGSTRIIRTYVCTWLSHRFLILASSLPHPVSQVGVFSIGLFSPSLAATLTRTHSLFGESFSSCMPLVIVGWSWSHFPSRPHSVRTNLKWFSFTTSRRHRLTTLIGSFTRLRQQDMAQVLRVTCLI